MLLLQFTNSLADLGKWLLKNHLFQATILVGNILLLIRYSGGFEIKAQAHKMMGNTEKAISILEFGIQKTPQVWVLHKLLGDYMSDSQKYKQAFFAYENALNIPQSDKLLIYYNYAIALERHGKIKEAYEKLMLGFVFISQSKDSTLVSHCNTLQQELLTKMKKAEE